MFKNLPENHYTGKDKEFNLPTWFSTINLYTFSAWVVAHFEKRIYLCFKEDSMNRHSKMPIELREEYTDIWKSMAQEEKESMISIAIGQLDNYRNEAFKTHKMRVGTKTKEGEKRRDPAIRNMSWDEVMFKNIFMLIPSEQQKDYNLYNREQLKDLLERRIRYQSNVASTNFVYAALTPNLKDAMRIERFCMNIMIMYLHDRYIQKNIDDLLEEETQEREVRRGKKRRKGGKAKARKKRKREKKEREKMRRKLEEQLSKNHGSIIKNKTFSTNNPEIKIKEQDETQIEIKKDIDASIKKVNLDLEDFEKKGNTKDKIMAKRTGKKVTEEDLKEIFGKEGFKKEIKGETEVTIERVKLPKKDEFIERLKADIKKKGDKMGILVPLLAEERKEGYKAVEGVVWENKNDDNKKKDDINKSKISETLEKKEISKSQDEPQIQIEITPKKTKKQIQKELAAEHIQRMIEETRKGPFKTRESDPFNPNEIGKKGTKSLCGGSLRAKRTEPIISKANPGSEFKEKSIGTTGYTHFWDDADLESLEGSAYRQKVKHAVEKLKNQNLIDEVRSQSCKGNNLFKDNSGEGKIVSEGNKSVQTARFTRDRNSNAGEIGHFGVSSLGSENFSKTESVQKINKINVISNIQERIKKTEIVDDKEKIIQKSTLKDLEETIEEQKNQKEEKPQIKNEKKSVSFIKEKNRESKSESKINPKKERKNKEKKITLRKSKKGRRNKQNKSNQRQKLVAKGASRKKQDESQKQERVERKKLERANFSNQNKGANKFWNSKLSKNDNFEKVQPQKDSNNQLKTKIDSSSDKKFKNTEQLTKKDQSVQNKETKRESLNQTQKNNVTHKNSVSKFEKDISKINNKESKNIQVKDELKNQNEKSIGPSIRQSKEKISVQKWKEEKQTLKKENKIESHLKPQKKNQKRKKKTKKRNKSENTAPKKRKSKENKKEVRNNMKIQKWDEVEETVATVKSNKNVVKTISNEIESKMESQNDKESQKNSIKNKDISKKDKQGRARKKTGKRKKAKNVVKGEKKSRDFKTRTWQETEDVRPVLGQKKKTKNKLRKNNKPFEFHMKPDQTGWNMNPYQPPFGFMGNPMMPPQSQGPYFQRFMNPYTINNKTQEMINDNSMSPMQNKPISNVQFFGDFGIRRRATSNALNVASSQVGLAKNQHQKNAGSSKNIGMNQPIKDVVMTMNINNMGTLMSQNMNNAPPGMTPNLNTLSLNMPPLLNINSGSKDFSNDLTGETTQNLEEKSRVSLHRSHEPLAFSSNIVRRDSDPFVLPTKTDSVHGSLQAKPGKSLLINTKEFSKTNLKESLESKLTRLVKEQQTKVHKMTEKAFESFSHLSLSKIKDNLQNEADMLEPHRQIILERIQNIVLKSFRSNVIKVIPYGSYATKLLTPFSDLDLAITFSDYREVSHERTIQILNTLENNLGLFDFVLEKKNVSSASVPVIKIVADASVPYKELPKTASESRHIKVDIIVGSVDSTRRPNSAFLTTEVITNYIHNYPPFYTLALFFKYALASNNLSNAFGGGLSAYGMCLLLISFLYYDSQENSSEFGQASLRFMHFLVHSFKPSIIAVNPAFVGYSRDQVFAGMPTMMGCQLFIADPTSKITKNVTPSCYRLYEVIDFFSKALDTLLRARSFMELKLLRKLQETINKDIPSGARLQFDESQNRYASDSGPQAFSLQAFTQSSVVMSQFDEKFKKNTAMDPRAEVLSHGPSPHFGAPLYKKVPTPVYQDRCASYSVKVRSEAQFRLISKSGLNISDNNPMSQLPQEQALTATTNNTASKNQTKKIQDLDSTDIVKKTIKRDSNDSQSHNNLKQNVTSNSKQIKDVDSPQSVKKVDSNEKYIFQSQDPTTELSQEKKEILKSEEIKSKVDSNLAKRKRNIEQQIENLKEFKIDKEHLVKLFEEFYPDLFKTAFNLTGKEQSECESVGHEKLQNDMNFNAQSEKKIRITKLAYSRY